MSTWSELERSIEEFQKFTQERMNEVNEADDDVRSAKADIETAILYAQQIGDEFDVDMTDVIRNLQQASETLSDVSKKLY